MTGSENAPDLTRTGGRRWSRWIGIATGAVGAAFVVKIFIDNREEVAATAGEAQPLLVVGALIVGLAAMTGIGITWRTALSVLGSKLGILSALRGYFVGQLGKYVPGGVWAIMGRGEWARAEGVPGAVAYSSVVLSMGSAYLSALLLGLALLPFSRLGDASGEVPIAIVLFLLPVGFMLIHPRVVGWVLAALRRLTGRELLVAIPSWGQSISLVVRQLPSWLLIGMANYLIAVGFGASGNAINVIAATAISWVIGFLALPVPGGIGVREAVFVGLASSLPVGIAATVALVARLVFVAVDTSGAAMTTFLLSRRQAEVN